MSEQSPEAPLYECKNCGRVFQAHALQERQECPTCHSSTVAELKKTPEPPRGLLARLFRRGSS